MATEQEKTKIQEKYKAAYTIANSIVRFSKVILWICLLVGIIFVITGVMGIAEASGVGGGNNPLAWVYLAVGVIAIIIGGIFETLIAAYGQLLLATLDVAVNTGVLVVNEAKKEAVPLSKAAPLSNP